VASALAAATPGDLLPLAASGWRDTTRIAGADPQLWQSIFTENKPAVLDALEMFTQILGNMREALDQGDHESLIGILEAAVKRKRDRDALGD
jgi:prephenate dehydrogenase